MGPESSLLRNPAPQDTLVERVVSSQTGEPDWNEGSGWDMIIQDWKDAKLGPGSREVL